MKPSRCTLPGPHWLPFLVALLGLTCGQHGVSKADAGVAKHGETRWESHIQRLEQRSVDAVPGSVVFVGSSSIRLWDSLSEDMEPMRVVHNGFGGALTREVLHYADRLVTKYQPRAVVYYAGDNDLGHPGQSTPERVRNNFRAFVKKVRATGQQPDIFFVSIKPSPRRVERWPEMRRANHIIHLDAQRDSQLHFIDVSRAMLDSNGRARQELFRSDGLHLNERGYAIWTTLIKPTVQDQLGRNPYYL